MICKRCGKEIRYIPITRDESVPCEFEETTIYTQSGRKVSGYKIHKCEVEDARNETEKDRR